LCGRRAHNRSRTGLLSLHQRSSVRPSRLRRTVRPTFRGHRMRRRRTGLLSLHQRNSARHNRFHRTVRLKLRDRKMRSRSGPPIHCHSSVRFHRCLVHKNGIEVHYLNHRRNVSLPRSAPRRRRLRVGPSRRRSAARLHRLQSSAGRHLLPHKSGSHHLRLVQMTKRSGRTITLRSSATPATLRAR
jgi:hypothetical protein